jgi:hypothetical protein
MRVSCRHRRFTLWLATLAMAFAALAPVMSHALALVSGSAGWVEVCTAQGSRWVQLEDASHSAPSPDSGGPLAGHQDHCPCCPHVSQGMAPPPAAATAPLALALNDGPPERFLSAPRTAHVWRAALARAPPSPT